MSDDFRYILGISWFVAVFLWSFLGLIGVLDKIDSQLNKRINTIKKIKLDKIDSESEDDEE